MLKGFRSLLSHSRVPVRLSNHPNAKLYRVRFINPPAKKPFYIRAAKNTTRLVFGIFAASFTYSVLLVLASEEPIFIPLGFAKKGPARQWTKNDPELAIFREFYADRNRVLHVRELLSKNVCKLLEDAYGNRWLERLGGNVQPDVAMLFFRFPGGPPVEYTQRGILISAIGDDDDEESDSPEGEDLDERADARFSIRLIEDDPNHAHQPSLIINNLMFESVTRSVDVRSHVHIRMYTLPFWTIKAFLASIKSSYLMLKSAPQETYDVRNFGTALGFGINLSTWMFAEFKRNLAQYRQALPPPRGHVMIDGIVQVVSPHLIVGIDVTASFSPQKPEEEMFIQQVHVRSVERLIRRPAPVPAKVLKKRNKDSLAPTVVAGVKQGMQRVRSAVMAREKKDGVNVDDNPQRTATKVAAHTGQRRDAAASSADSLVDEEEQKILEQERKDMPDAVPDQEEQQRRRGKVQEGENRTPSPPSSPSSSSSPPPAASGKP